MPKVGQMRTSKFLKREDCGEDGTLVTIKKVDQVNVALEGEAPEERWCMFFREFEKPMVLNTTNAQLCEKFLNSDDTDDWIGKQVIVYDELNVSFGGKLVGGIRIKRAPSGRGPATRPAKPAEREPGEDDDVPWPAE